VTCRIAIALLVALVGPTILAPPSRAQAPSFLGRTAGQWQDDLGDTRPEVRRGAAFALGSLGKDATRSVDALLARAEKDADAGVRDQAATAVGDVVLANKTGVGLWPRAGPVLRRALAAEKDAKVRRSLLYAVGAFGPPAFSARDLLLQALDDLAEPAVRQNAAWALGRLGEDAGEAAVKALVKRLQDDDALVRRDAATALGEIGPSASELAVPPLFALVDRETDDVVRRTALEQLVNLVTPKDTELLKVLSPLVKDKDPETARLAAFVVANIGGDEAVAALPVLRGALKDDDSRMQGLAAAALARLGPAAADATGDLTALLGESTDAVTQRNCALALGRIGPGAKSALPALVEHLKPPAADEIRQLCAEAIARIGYPANKDVLPALLDPIANDPDPAVRRACIFPYMQFEDLKRHKGVIEVLTGVLDVPGDDMKVVLLRYDAARTLAYNLGADTPDKAIESLMHMLGNKDLVIYQGREAKVSGVGTEGAGGVSEVKVNSGGDARYLAAQALGQAGRKAANDEKVVAALKEAAEDKDERLRKEARDALKKLGR
jgi:HEAT repeat protein